MKKAMTNREGNDFATWISLKAFGGRCLTA